MSRSHTQGHTSLEYSSNIYLISVSNSLWVHQKKKNQLGCCFLSLQLYFLTVYRKDPRKIRAATGRRASGVSGLESPPTTTQRTPTMPSTVYEFRPWIQIRSATYLLCDYGQVTEPLLPKFSNNQEYLPHQSVMKIKYCPVQITALRVEGEEQNHRSPHKWTLFLSCYSVLPLFV